MDECEAQGRPIPDRIADTTLLPGAEVYYLAFRELSTCRAFGFGVGPIPWTAIVAWADDAGYDPEQREALQYVVREMDSVYLEHLEKKREQERKSQDAKSKRSRGKFGRKKV